MHMTYNFVCEYINPSQFGFLPRHSTTQQLLSVLTNIYASFSSNSVVDCVYFDIKKAFDVVPHSKLLTKLQLFGFTGDLWKWFKSYLLHRQQCVNIDGVYLSILPVLSGVPQGSVLGPLLFLIYINDLPTSLSTETKPYLFADDSKCLQQINSIEDCRTLQNSLNSALTWSLKWNMSQCDENHLCQVL